VGSDGLFERKRGRESLREESENDRIEASYQVEQGYQLFHE